MSLQIKICGMRERENIEQISSLMPDYLGFIFYSASLRYVGNDFSLDWFKQKKGSIKTVGVFVNHDFNFIQEQLEKQEFDVIQLHGSEDPEFCAELKKQFKDTLIWKAFAVDGSFEFSSLADYRESCEAYLFDNKWTAPGGSGESFDWSLLENYVSDKSLILSGGIGLDNIEKAVFTAGQDLRIKVMDINSKAEISPGIKSAEIVSELIKKVRT